MLITRIISGGQTGADQAGLAAALELGIETGGWMPRGWKTETGCRPDLAVLYDLKEHASSSYPPRTAQNVQDSDGTLWVGRTSSPGFFCTRNAAVRLSKPMLTNPTPETLRRWVEQHSIRVLNVAGNRESKNPGIYRKTCDLILAALAGTG